MLLEENHANTNPTLETLESCCLLALGKVLRRERSCRYEGRKSCPHSDTQWLSSTANIARPGPFAIACRALVHPVTWDNKRSTKRETGRERLRDIIAGPMPHRPLISAALWDHNFVKYYGCNVFGVSWTNNPKEQLYLTRQRLQVV